jgi:Ras GTPase-activating-like protein IQGAP1
MFKLGRAPQIDDLEGILKFTEEEINSMQEALNKYNIQLPLFSKIGGLLASEISIDEAALHAAILAINNALELKDVEDLREKINNADAHIESSDIVPDRMETYLVKLSAEREKKIIAGLIKNPAMNENQENNDPEQSFAVMDRDEDDAYAVNLTQIEIQGHLKRINKQSALDTFIKAVTTGNVKLLAQSAAELNLTGFREKNVKFYIELAKELKNIEVQNLEPIIEKGNKIGDMKSSREENFREIKKSIKEHDSNKLLIYLTQPSSQLPEISPMRGDIYLAELESIEELTSELLSSNIETVSKIVQINRTLEDNGECDDVLNLLHQLQIDSVDECNKEGFGLLIILLRLSELLKPGKGSLLRIHAKKK